MRLIIVLLLWLPAFTASAHIGSPNVFLEGSAGAYPVSVVIRPPNVVPGLAEISVRVRTNGVAHVRVLPIYWNAGRNGAPPPDEAVAVRGETNLFTANLWLMKLGAYSVEVQVEGSAGSGQLTVPVNAVATNTKPMTVPYRVMLGLLATVLVLGAIRLSGAIFGESVLEPGAKPSRRDLWRGRVAMLVTSVAVGLLLYGGSRWWAYEEKRYRNDSLYQPAPVTAEIREEGAFHLLNLKVNAAERRGKWTRLLPDHGKMMHLFLVRDGDATSFAHLHPSPRSATEFQTALPPLPEGLYHVYGDVTHENGFAETLTAGVRLPAPSATLLKLWPTNPADPLCASPAALGQAARLAESFDPDDTWHIEQGAPKLIVPADPSSGQAAPPEIELGQGLKLVWLEGFPVRTQRASSLRFRLLGSDGKPVPIEPYMGMLGHMVVRRADGTVFSHVHPSGNFSMASQTFFESKLGARSDGVGAPGMVSTNAAGQVVPHPQHPEVFVDSIQFPYEFPQPGPYRIWVQIKSKGRVVTGAFSAVFPGT